MTIDTQVLPDAAGRCLLIQNFLTQAECAALIADSEKDGYASASTDYPPSYRNNDRHVLDSAALAGRLDERLRRHVPATIAEGGREWHCDGINARFRFCRYRAGQRFNVHQDGVHHRGAACRSFLTFLVYLTDGAAFEGGDTVFYAQGEGAAGVAGLRELGRVRPEAGSLLLFDHAIWHAGDEVTAGIKHVLRSDVMYRAAVPDELAADENEHRGYIWTLAELENGAMASGGRDAAIRIRDVEGRTIHSLLGHEQSVLGLAVLPGQRLASVSRDRSLRVWDWSTGQCITNIAAHGSAVLDVIALANQTLATGAADGVVGLWTPDGSALGSLRGHAGWVWQLAACEGGIASASEDGSVRIWDLASMHCTAVLEGDQPLRTLLVDQGKIWTGDIAGRLVCWTRGAHGWTRSAPIQAHRAAIRRLRRIGGDLIASCGEDCALRIWDIASAAQVYEARHDNIVTDVLRRGDVILSSSYDGRILEHVGWLQSRDTGARP